MIINIKSLKETASGDIVYLAISPNLYILLMPRRNKYFQHYILISKWKGQSYLCMVSEEEGITWRICFGNGLLKTQHGCLFYTVREPQFNLNFYQLIRYSSEENCIC